MAKKKTPKEVDPFFKNMVEIYFNFCRDNLGDNPTFDGSSPRDLKAIIKDLHERSIKSGIEWTADVARARFSRFLSFAYQDNWLQKNWLLSNLSRQKDKIFFDLRKTVNQLQVDPFE